ncbi:unnamed protein product [Alopecurus aequalis]
MSSPADRSPPWEEGRTSTRIKPSSTPPSPAAVERLTTDLLVEILSRIPVKSLCRSNTITDNWLLEPPIHITSFPGALRRCLPIDTSFAFLPKHRCVHLLDCCNGLLLCRWYDISARGDEFRYVVCNPATEKWIILPDSGKATNEVGAVSLGFDPTLSSHFHVFQFVMDQQFYWDPDIIGVAVYSSETGRWVYKEKRWNAQIRIINHQLASVFLNGYLHFQADCRGFSPCLVVVDTEGETWMDFGVPDGVFDGFIQRSQGRLHYANFQRHEDGVLLRLVVYVLDNYESKEWILKHRIEYCLYGGIDPSMDRGFDWIAIHPECNLIFFTIGWENKFMCYDMDRRRQVKMISKLVDNVPPYLPYVPLYAELQSLQN